MDEPRLTQTVIGWAVAIAIVVMAYLSGTESYALDWRIMFLLLGLVFMLLYGQAATIDVIETWRGNND